MKISLALAGTLLLVSSLAACGGGSDSDGGGGGGGDAKGSGDYCKDLKAAKASFSGIGSGGSAKLSTAFSEFHKLAGEAPSSIKSDWTKIDGAIVKIEAAVDKAGLKVSDLDDIVAGKTPEGVDLAKMQELGKQFQSLASADFTAATTSIEKHAKSECGVDLNAS